VVTSIRTFLRFTGSGPALAEAGGGIPVARFLYTGSYGQLVRQFFV